MGCANPKVANHLFTLKSFLRACCLVDTILIAGDILGTKSPQGSLYSNRGGGQQIWKEIANIISDGNKGCEVKQRKRLE